MAKTSASSPSRPTAIASGKRIQVRRSGVHGKGVFALQDIAEGETLIEYVGEVISWDEAQDRHPHDPNDPNHTFYFHVNEDRVIDALFGGNSSRWINHSCAPNCEAEEDARKRVFLHALRDIAAGEELFFDYGLVVDGRYTAKLKAEYACHCGSPNCRGTMLAPKRARRAAPVVTHAAVLDVPLYEKGYKDEPSNIAKEAIAEATTANARRLFRLPDAATVARLKPGRPTSSPDARAPAGIPARANVVSRPKPAPTASSAVEAKKDVACWRPVMMLASTRRTSRFAICRIHSRRCVFIAAESVCLCSGDMSISQPRNHQAARKNASAPPSSQVIVRSDIQSALFSTTGR